MQGAIKYSFVHFYASVHHSSVYGQTYIMYLLSPLEYSFPGREKKSEYID